MSSDWQEITDLPGAKKSSNNGETTNNVIYLIVVEDLFPKKKIKCFVAVKYSAADSMISFRGAEVSATQANQLSSYDDAIEAANKAKSSIVELTYPRQRLVSIKNVTYRNKG